MCRFVLDALRTSTSCPAVLVSCSYGLGTSAIEAFCDCWLLVIFFFSRRAQWAFALAILFQHATMPAELDFAQVSKVTFSFSLGFLKHFSSCLPSAPVCPLSMFVHPILLTTMLFNWRCGKLPNGECRQQDKFCPMLLAHKSKNRSLFILYKQWLWEYIAFASYQSCCHQFSMIPLWFCPFLSCFL